MIFIITTETYQSSHLPIIEFIFGNFVLKKYFDSDQNTRYNRGN